MVATHEGWFRKGVDVVRVNQYRKTLSLLKHIHAAGYRRIGICIRYLTPMHPDDESRLGAASSFSNWILTDPERIPILRIPFEAGDVEGKLAGWVEKHDPDVVLGFNVTEFDLLEKTGCRIPGERAFVAMHVEFENQGRIAGCQYNMEIIPEYAVRVLYEKMCHGVRGLSVHPRETIVDTPIWAGASCPLLVGDSQEASPEL